MGKGNRARSLVLLVVLAAAIAGCFPGGHGWKCDSDSDCDKGLVCKQFGNLFKDNVCVSPGTSSIRSDAVHGWFGLVLFWGVAGVVSLSVLAIGGAVAVEAIRDRFRR
jgi:hypothetical protein